MLRVIREEEPPKPSTRLSTIAELPSIAAQRGLEPKKLSGLVKGELDWIVMKCLEKDRNRRYETASSLALDLQCHLTDQPVEACPPSAAISAEKIDSPQQGWRADRLGNRCPARVSDRGPNGEQRPHSPGIGGEGCRSRHGREAVDQMLVRVSDEHFMDVPRAHPLREGLMVDAVRFYEEFLVHAGSESDVTLREQLARVLGTLGASSGELGRYDEASARYSVVSIFGRD